MKYVLLAIFVFIASLPVEAAYCDMHDSQGTSHGQHGGMMDHGQMDHNNMDHGKMNHDCCDQDKQDSNCKCNLLKHCGASAAGAATIDSAPLSIAYITGHRQLNGDSARALSRYGSPPFRPPIT